MIIPASTEVFLGVDPGLEVGYILPQDFSHLKVKDVARVYVQFYVEIYAFQRIMNLGVPGATDGRVPGPSFGGHRYCSIFTRLPRNIRAVS